MQLVVFILQCPSHCALFLFAVPKFPLPWSKWVLQYTLPF